MDRYLMLGLSTAFVIVVFFGFSGSENQEYEFDGIAYDIHESSKGFTFSFDASDGSTFRCFSEDEPEELGRYMIEGDFSEDDTIYFIKHSLRLDIVQGIRD